MKPVDVNETKCILGAGELLTQSLADLEQLKGQGRVWFLFSHYSESAKNQFLQYLDEIGQRLNTQHQAAVALYLYEL